MFLPVVILPQLSTKNHAVALSLLPTPWWDGDENQNEKAKLLGCNKNSLSERQREKKITTIILTERIYSMQCAHWQMLSLLLSSKIPFLQPAPHLTTEYDITWYRISHLIR